MWKNALYRLTTAWLRKPSGVRISYKVFLAKTHILLRILLTQIKIPEYNDSFNIESQATALRLRVSRVPLERWNIRRKFLFLFVIRVERMKHFAYGYVRIHQRNDDDCLRVCSSKNRWWTDFCCVFTSIGAVKASLKIGDEDIFAMCSLLLVH